MRVVTSFLLVLALLVPIVDAHLAHPSQSTLLEMSGFKLALTPVPSPVTAGTPTKFVLVDVLTDPDRPLSNASIHITTTSDDAVVEHSFQRNGTLWETPEMVFPDVGTLAARVVLEPQDESEGRFSFSVYLALPFDVFPIDATSDPTARRPYALTFRTFDQTSQQPQDLVSDLGAMLFPADTDPGAGDRFENVTFAKNGTGTWSANVTFDFAGPWRIHLTSRSGGFEMTEAPPWQVDVLSPTVPETKGRIGGPNLLVGLIAALVAALGTRRRAR